MRILIFAITLIAASANAQSLIGKYDTRNESHTNNRHYEELILNSDSTFSYSTRMEFIKINKEGKWSASGDTIILNEHAPCCREKMIVEERCNKKLSRHRVRFTVTSLEDEDINYHLVVIGRDSTQTIWSTTGVTEIKIRKLKQFHFIVNSLVVSPEHYVKSSRSNEFIVKLAPNRFFYNEKWLIRDGTIIPVGWDNQYAGYYLKKQN